jgi:hypothetical protein
MNCLGMICGQSSGLQPDYAWILERAPAEVCGGPGIRYGVSTYQRRMTMDVLGKRMAKLSHVQRLGHAVRARQVAIYSLAMTPTRRQSVLGCALRRERDKRRRVVPSEMTELLSNSCQEYSGERLLQADLDERP